MSLVKSESLNSFEESVLHISELRRRNSDRRTLDEPLVFERMVCEWLVEFTNLRAEDVDGAITRAQRRIVDAADVDGMTIFELTEGGNDFALTHSWTRSGDGPPTLVRSARQLFPWSYTHARAGTLASYASRDEITDAAERQTLEHYDMRSGVVVPFSIDGHAAGAVYFTSTREPYRWPAETLNRLHLIAEVLSTAIARKQSQAVLRASQERLAAIADSASVMIWVCDAAKRCTWFNRRWLEAVGRTMDDALRHGWLDGIHPDDRESCLDMFTAAFEARRPLSMEWRLRRNDGELRWIAGTASPAFASDGAFTGYIGSCLDITEQKDAQLGMDKARIEVRRLREQLRNDSGPGQRDVVERPGDNIVVGQSAAARLVLEQIEQVASTDSTVLLLGETGTGKELCATQIHERSTRHARAMVRVNCAAIPSTLIESELFGREKGAFTGALARQVGRFEVADRSTIFLDEVGDLPAEVQVKLLRVLEERRFERLGSPKVIPVDTRIIAATHRNLEQLMVAGTFREDLYYRLNVFPIRVPALRERVEDIPLLVWHFVDEFSKAFGKRIETIAKSNMEGLQRYAWPGNIREIRNVVERAMITAAGPRLTIPVPETSSAASGRSIRLIDVERTHIRRVLEGTRWRIRGVGGAAEQLGLKPTTLETRLAKLGLKRPAATV
jgi:formate hydrogenlyase transcriptional activator